MKEGSGGERRPGPRKAVLTNSLLNSRGKVTQCLGSGSVRAYLPLGQRGRADQ